MSFTWVNFDTAFIREILEASKLDAQQRADMDYALKNNDKDFLISILCTVHN